MNNPIAFKILIVENSRTTQAAMSVLLESHGYKVHCVRNGRDAITAVQSTHFDLILMDLYMPMMNGYEAASNIRKSKLEYQNIPIIALTASTDPKDIEVCKKAGMNEFFLKSRGDEALMKSIDSYRNNHYPFPAADKKAIQYGNSKLTE